MYFKKTVQKKIIIVKKHSENEFEKKKLLY